MVAGVIGSKRTLPRPALSGGPSTWIVGGGTVSDHDQLEKLEALGIRLRRAVEAARSQGWRAADLEWVVRRRPDRRLADLFAHIVVGPVRWAETRGVPLDAAVTVATLLAFSLEFLPPLPEVVDTRDSVD